VVNISAREKKVARDSLTMGDRVRSDTVLSSMRSSGAKNRVRYRAGSGEPGDKSWP
jgi:hypothetical protein